MKRFRHLARCARLAMVAAGAMALGGCGVMTIPGMPIDSGLQTSSIRSHGPLLAAARISDGVMPADWEAVRRAVVGIPTDKSAEAVEWSNPSTGSEGTILSADRAASRGGALCRDFSTTINDMRGIRRYQATLCRKSDGSWGLYDAKPDDTKFL